MLAVMRHASPVRCLGLLLLVASCTAAEPGGSDPADAGAGADGAPEPTAAITLDEPPGPVVATELVLLRGTLEEDADRIGIERGGEILEWPVVDRRFKALVRLAPGENRVELGATGHAPLAVTLTLAPPAAELGGRTVRMVYLVASDGDGSFQAPPGEPADEASAVRRLALAGLLMQTATAEMMRRAGHGPMTFQLARDAGGQVLVDVVRTSLSTAEARAMEGGDLWQHFNAELSARPGADTTKVAAIMGMTWYDAETGQVSAHTALGGGNLGLFGSGGLHTWAEDLDQLAARFSDERMIAELGLFDDSAGRNAAWANFATGVGALLHELGHTFGLPHVEESYGVMNRGFDRFNRLFMLTEAGGVFAAEEIGWAPSSAAGLAGSPWFAGVP